MDIVSALRQAVADRVGRERFHLWFGESAQFLWDGVRVFIIVPNQFYLDWLRTRFRKHVDEGCAAVLGYSPAIDFRLKPPAKTNPRPSLFTQPEVLRANLRLDGSPPSASLEGNGEATGAVAEKSLGGRTNMQSKGASATCLSGDAPIGLSGSVELNATLPESCDVISVSANAHVVAADPSAGRMTARTAEVRAATTRSTGGDGEPSPNGGGARPNGSPVQPTLFAMDEDFGEASATAGASSSKGAARSQEDRRTDIPAPDASPFAPAIAGSCETTQAGCEEESPPCSRSRAVRRGRRFASLRDFIVGPCNQLAFAAAETVIQHLGEYSPLTIYGPTGTGKTHLLEGVWSAVRQRHRHLPALYLSAEQFTSAFIDAVKGGGVAALRMKYRGVRLLILDDLQFFRGKRQTQIELLYTVDALLKNGSQVICAADRSPQELGELGSELISRLQSGMVCRLDPPDAAMRMEIVCRAARSVNLNLSEPVCRWLSQRLAGDVRQLTGAVCRLKAFAGTSGAPIGRKEAEEVLADLMASSSGEVPIAEIEQAICRTLGLPDKSLHADTKDRRISGPRMLAMWLARKYTRAPLNEIGRYFGKKSHATVIAAQKRVDQWLAENAELRADRRAWKVADVIEEVHRQLRVG